MVTLTQDNKGFLTDIKMDIKMEFKVYWGKWSKLTSHLTLNLAF